MKVVEIFDSIDGEGIRTGQPATFIRLAGCNLRCTYCDTLYALFGEKEECKYTEMTIDEIAERVNPVYKRVTLTGGEPLIARDSDELCARLIGMGCEVNIETNGAVDIADFIQRVPDTDRLFFTIDYKLPSSGMSDKMIWSNFLCLKEYDVIKFVIGSREDIRVTCDIMAALKKHYKKMPHVFLGAVYGRLDMQELVDAILTEPALCDVRLQVQLHKIIWSPDERGV